MNKCQLCRGLGCMRCNFSGTNDPETLRLMKAQMKANIDFEAPYIRPAVKPSLTWAGVKRWLWLMILVVGLISGLGALYQRVLGIGVGIYSTDAVRCVSTDGQ